MKYNKHWFIKPPNQGALFFVGVFLRSVKIATPRIAAVGSSILEGVGVSHVALGGGFVRRSYGDDAAAPGRIS